MQLKWKRGLIGGIAAAGLVAAMAVVASPAAQASSTPSTPQAAPPLAAQAAAATVATRPAYLHASAQDNFVAHQVITGQGAQYVPYDRTYAGLPVIGGDFVIITDNSGHVLDHSVAQHQAISLTSVTPTVTPAQSLAVARRLLDRVSSTTTPVLSVYAKGTPRLAWNDKVTGRQGNEPSILSVYVDAVTGAVLGTQEHVAFGDGTGVYNGPEPLHLDTTQSGGQYTMADPNVTNLECDDLTNNSQVETKSTDSWGNGDETNIETGCVDALYTAETEVKMLHDWLGRNAMDGNGGAWPIRVGLADENAFYDGSQVQVGHNAANDWIGSLDVVGHEMGHGIDDHTPGSMSGNGTQEFVADTFGKATEWYANESAPYEMPNFAVGQMVNLQGNGPIRYMYDPSKVNMPNCYDDSVPGMEVHAASGPGDHWYYLVAEGTNPTDGQPTSPTCNNSTVTGIGIENTIKVMYNAMLMKTSAASYQTYRTWTLKAAKLLFPNDCTEFNTVQAAWDAVSVAAQPDDPTCSASGGVLATNPGGQSGTVGTATKLQLAATGGTPPYTWTATGLPAGLTVSASGLISGTPTTANSYTVTATVKDKTGATNSTSFAWTITPGGGGGVTVTNPGSQSGTVGTATSLQLAATGGTAPYTWTATGLPTGLTASTAGKITGTPSAAGSFTVTATATDSKGAKGSATFTWTIAGGGGCSGVPAWSATTAYSPNDVVSHNGHKWTSLWYSTGVEPDSPEAWDIWQDDGAC